MTVLPIRGYYDEPNDTAVSQGRVLLFKVLFYFSINVKNSNVVSLVLT